MEQLRQVERLVDGVLGDGVLGVCLHGSSVLGGLRPASDLDVLVVSRSPMAAPQRRSLLDGLLRISCLDGGTRPVELTVVVQSDVRPWRYPPIGDFLYGEWLRGRYEAGEVPRREPMPDLAVLLTMALDGDRALSGPPPSALLDPVPHADLVPAMRAGLPELLEELGEDTRNVVLTLARIWSTLATGRIRPKDAAADWALYRLPPEHRPVLEHARRLYLERGYEEERWPEGLRDQAGAHAEAVLERIDGIIGDDRAAPG